MNTLRFPLKKPSKRWLFIITVIILTAPVIIFPDKYVSSVLSGLELYVLKVLPALLPFMFFSMILSELNFGYDLGYLLNKPLKKIFCAPPISGYVMVMSMLCGYPVGAKLLADFFNAGCIDTDSAKKIMTFTSNSGPLFIMGTVGVGMLGDKKAGLIILLSHYLSSFVCGIIFRGKTSCGKTPSPPIVDYDNLLSKSIISAITSVFIVGGYVAIFNMILDMFFDVGLIKLLAEVLSRFGVDIRMGEGIFAGLIEITKGSLILSKTGLSIRKTAPAITFIITSGGLCVTLQSITYLSKCKISPAFYLVFKVIQGTVAMIICLIICLIVY